MLGAAELEAVREAFETGGLEAALSWVRASLERLGSARLDLAIAGTADMGRVLDVLLGLNPGDPGAASASEPVAPTPYPAPERPNVIFWTVPLGSVGTAAASHPSPRYDASNENKYVPRTPPCCRPTDGHEEAPLRPPGPRVGLSRAPAAGPGLEAMSPLRPAWPGGSSGRAPAASLIGCFKGVTVKPTVARPNRVEPAVRPVCAHGS